MAVIQKDEIFFDRKYQCFPCSNCFVTFMSTSRNTIRPEVGPDGGLFLRLHDLVCVERGEDFTLDFGLRLNVSGCPLLCSFKCLIKATLVSDAVVSVTTHLDLVLTLTNVYETFLLLDPNEPVFLLFLRSSCCCVRLDRERVLALTPGEESANPVSLNLVEPGTVLFVHICSFRVAETIHGCISERMLRWVYSEQPSICKLSTYSVTTGQRSVELSGIQDFYKRLNGISGPSSVVVFSSCTGLHQLMETYRTFPDSVPIKYKCMFQRARFLPTVQRIPFELQDYSLDNEVVRRSMRLLSERVADAHRRTPFVYVGHLPVGLAAFFRIEIPDLVIQDSDP